MISTQLVHNIEGLDTEEKFDAVFDDLTFTTTLRYIAYRCTYVDQF